MRIFIFLLLFWGCSHQFIVDCNDNNYFVSSNINTESSFENQQREVITTFSEKELNSLFGDTGVSCKNILADFFYCNICFNNEADFLISYSGRRFNLDVTKDPNEFTNNIIELICSMQMGADEYSYFLNSHPNSFSKKDSIIQPIRIKAH
ncbi:MAG: hypothetical protein CMD23_01105 [Flavobacteriales bacterium]|nr:hypothetical protein [Flavobacteriales bacterium]